MSEQTISSRILTFPNYLFFAVFFAYFVSFLGKGDKVVWALVHAFGVNLIPIMLGFLYTLSGGKKSKIAYVIVTILFIFILVGSTIYDARIK